MPDTSAYDELPLPRTWTAHVKSAVIQAISLAHAAIIQVRGMCVNSSLARVRLAGERERSGSEVSMLTEEVRIKDGRMERIDPRKRPHYSSIDRMAILELRAARGWSLAETARRFHVEPDTIRSWTRRVDEEGRGALVTLRTPVNKYPDFVRYMVKSLKTLCPLMGKVKIAEHLARQGLHLAATTVGRMVREEPVGPTFPAAAEFTGEDEAPRRIIARFPNSVWGIDLTLVPIVGGLWTCWMPFSFPQCWPFAWWVLAVVDHFSRRAMGVEVFKKQPTSENVTSFLNTLITRLGRAPKYTVTDQGKQFKCDNYRAWCHPHILPRYGAVGKYGSIAVVERFMRTLKDECTRRIMVPLDIVDMRAELEACAAWFNAHRPHEYLGGKTPDEAYFGKKPANKAPRFEPRAKYPRRGPCASPQVPVRGPTGVKLKLIVDYHAGRRHLPIIRLKRTA